MKTTMGTHNNNPASANRSPRTGPSVIADGCIWKIKYPIPLIKENIIKWNPQIKSVPMDIVLIILRLPSRFPILMHNVMIPIMPKSAPEINKKKIPYWQI